jgi:hypothetical protein
VRPGRKRGRLLRLVIAFGFAQGAVSMARPAVSYRALALRLTGNRLGQAAAAPVAGPAGVAAPFAMPAAAALLRVALRSPREVRAGEGAADGRSAGRRSAGRRSGSGLRRSSDV